MHGSWYNTFVQYKSLEAMVNVIKIDASKSGSEAQLSDKTEKSLVRPRGSSSPFRCIGNLVQQVNTEKDQELSLAKLRVEDLQTLASNRQKEVIKITYSIYTWYYTSFFLHARVLRSNAQHLFTDMHAKH